MAQKTASWHWHSLWNSRRNNFWVHDWFTNVSIWSILSKNNPLSCCMFWLCSSGRFWSQGGDPQFCPRRRSAKSKFAPSMYMIFFAQKLDWQMPKLWMDVLHSRKMRKKKCLGLASVITYMLCFRQTGFRLYFGRGLCAWQWACSTWSSQMLAVYESYQSHWTSNDSIRDDNTRKGFDNMIIPGSGVPFKGTPVTPLPLSLTNDTQRIPLS